MARSRIDTLRRLGTNKAVFLLLEWLCILEGTGNCVKMITIQHDFLVRWAKYVVLIGFCQKFCRRQDAAYDTAGSGLDGTYYSAGAGQNDCLHEI